MQFHGEVLRGSQGQIQHTFTLSLSRKMLLRKRALREQFLPDDPFGHEHATVGQPHRQALSQSTKSAAKVVITIRATDASVVSGERSFARGFGWRFGNDASRIVERAVENELGD